MERLLRTNGTCYINSIIIVSCANYSSSYWFALYFCIWTENTRSQPRWTPAWLAFVQYGTTTNSIYSSLITLSRDLALHLFRENVVSPPETDKRVLSGLLALIEQDRLGETVDRTLVSSLVRMYSALNLYTDHFEKHFLETTHAFYVAESENKMQDIDVSR